MKRTTRYCTVYNTYLYLVLYILHVPCHAIARATNQSIHQLIIESSKQSSNQTPCILTQTTHSTILIVHCVVQCSDSAPHHIDIALLQLWWLVFCVKENYSSRHVKEQYFNFISGGE